MPAASSVNENVAAITPGTTDTGLYACWRLTRVLISAGWTLAQSSDGTSFGASDYWTTAGGLAAGAWIVLTGPGGRQFCFWRDTGGSLWTGRVIYSRSGGHTFASATATNPGTLPATAQYMRGSGAAFTSWFGGGTKAIKYLHVLAQDVSDGSFWIMGTTPTTTLDSHYHMFGFLSLQTYDANDVDPYILYCPTVGPTSDTSASANAHLGGIMATGNSDGSNTGPWWGWARNTNWRAFTAVWENLQSSTFDVDPYTAGQPWYAMPLQIGKSETGFRERKGFVRYARMASITSMTPARPPLSDATGPFRWVMVGYDATSGFPQIYLWWDPAAPTMGYSW